MDSAKGPARREIDALLGDGIWLSKDRRAPQAIEARVQMNRSRGASQYAASILLLRLYKMEELEEKAEREDRMLKVKRDEAARHAAAALTGEQPPAAEEDDETPVPDDGGRAPAPPPRPPGEFGDIPSLVVRNAANPAGWVERVGDAAEALRASLPWAREVRRPRPSVPPSF